MFSRNLSVLDFVRRFFVNCAQISKAYAIRMLMKFECDWRKIGHKGKCWKNSKRTLNTQEVFLCLRFFHILLKTENLPGREIPPVLCNLILPLQKEIPQIQLLSIFLITTVLIWTVLCTLIQMAFLWTRSPWSVSSIRSH